LTTFFDREFRRTLQVRVIGVELKFQRQATSEVRNRRQGFERLTQTLLHEKVETVSLDFEEVRQGVSLTQC
jgi:hypothetical protein